MNIYINIYGEEINENCKSHELRECSTSKYRAKKAWIEFSIWFYESVSAYQWIQNISYIIFKIYHIQIKEIYACSTSKYRAKETYLWLE